MMYCKQRQALLDFNTQIEVRGLVSGKVRSDQLKVWLAVDYYDKHTGDVYTQAGVWHYNDLDMIQGGTMEQVRSHEHGH